MSENTDKSQTSAIFKIPMRIYLYKINKKTEQMFEKYIATSQYLSYDVNKEFRICVFAEGGFK